MKIETDDAELLEIVGAMGPVFAKLCIISEVTIQQGPALKITASKCAHGKCERCWNYYPSVGQHPETPDLCTRCAAVVGG